MEVEKNQRYSQSDIALAFLKLGTIGFGGPAAHLALMQNEFVEKRKWVTHDELLDYMSASNFIPGPNSTEVAIHIGYKVGGRLGLFVAGFCFILPAALIVTFIASLYVSYGQLPEVQSMLYAIKPVIIGVLLQALWSLSRTAFKNSFLIALFCFAIIALIFGVNELIVLLFCGVASTLMCREFSKTGLRAFLPLSGAAMVATVAAPFSLTKLFLFFLKVGSVLFGSGYVLVGFLRADLVERWHWLTESQLLDAVAVGQFTPGPVFTTATFIGYLLAESNGALVATVGIFLPAFFFVAISAPFISKLRRSEKARFLLDGLNVGSLAVMAMGGFYLGYAALVDAMTIGIAIVSAVLLIRFKVNSAWLVLAAGFAGWVF